MIKEFVDAWDANKEKLEEYFRTTRQEEYNNYRTIVYQLFKKVINPYFLERIETPFDIETVNEKYRQNNGIVEIDDGDYQGTLLYIIHRGCYQPGIRDYILTFVNYGSCSGCDTLQGIHQYSDDLPSEEQVAEYMTLALHILQNCRPLIEEI